MQEQAAQADLVAQALVHLGVAVFVVAGNRMTEVLCMHTDLVGAPGLDAYLAVGMPAATLQQPEVAQRRLADRIDLHMPLAALAQADVQRRIHTHHPVGHPPH